MCPTTHESFTGLHIKYLLVNKTTSSEVTASRTFVHLATVFCDSNSLGFDRVKGATKHHIFDSEGKVTVYGNALFISQHRCLLAKFTVRFNVRAFLMRS
jgi:hypothetical protein